MTHTPLPPLFTSPNTASTILKSEGYALLRAAEVCELAHTTLAALQMLSASWNDLPPDNYLKDGGRYRRRRHSCFVVEGATVTQTPHRAHWQPTEYNALHGGMQRMFEPIVPATITQPAWPRLLQTVGRVCTQVKGVPRWYVEAHQFRIDTTDGIGRPTPEGAHRDGVDFVAIFLVDRVNVKGGESRIFEAEGPNGKRFTLIEPWSLLLLDDERIIHESTPIQPTTGSGHRDTLVLTYRANGFQEA